MARRHGARLVDYGPCSSHGTGEASRFREGSQTGNAHVSTGPAQSAPFKARQ